MVLNPNIKAKNSNMYPKLGEKKIWPTLNVKKNIKHTKTDPQIV